MKIDKIQTLIHQEPFASSAEFKGILEEIKEAIKAVVWPKGNKLFIINPSRGKGRKQGNGVKPIKDACMLILKKHGWLIESRKQEHLRFDALKLLQNGKYFGLEWETGNVSSSHRSINRIFLAHKKGALQAGALIVPTREMYNYLTDRVGNLQEIEPYFDVWKSYPMTSGVLAIISVEHDGTDRHVPRIKKGTDGRALV